MRPWARRVKALKGGAVRNASRTLSSRSGPKLRSPKLSREDGKLITGRTETAHDFACDLFRGVPGAALCRVDADDENRVVYWPEIRSGVNLPDRIADRGVEDRKKRLAALN
jgi:hypothetical protein